MNLAVIILQRDEALHIRRCLERLAPLNPSEVFIVDSGSTDGSMDIAREAAAALHLNLHLCSHDWPGTQARQFNWALDNLPITAEWILRLDADEYLYPETCEEVEKLIADVGLPSDVTSISLSRARVFCNRKIRFGGTAHVLMVRFFKYGIGRCEDRAMDEHIVTSEGRDYRLKGEFTDHNLNTMDWWRDKHRGYAKREAQDAIALFSDVTRLANPSLTDRKKIAYYRLPPYFRALAYFCLRYFLKGGFLDGIAGWRWHFWQGLWYRWLVDREIGRMGKNQTASKEVAE